MSVVRWWVVLPVGWGYGGWYFLWVGGRGWGAGVPLVYECCKMVGGTSCGLGVGGQGVPVVWVDCPVLYECCKMVGGVVGV